MAKSALIVEDVHETRLFMKHLLEELGVEKIDTAGNGSVAANLLEANKYDLVLLDLELPDINGKELLDKYKVDHPEMSVIICSSHNSVDNVRDTWDLGANGFLAKPVELDKLQNLINRIRRPQNSQ